MIIKLSVNDVGYLQLLIANVLPELCPSDKDLLYVCSKVGVKVTVHDDIYELIGEIS